MSEALGAVIDRARAGDKQAFSQLVVRYQKHIIQVAYNLLGQQEDAEEVAQEAFFKAYVALPKLTHSEAFYKWLVRITTNLSLERLRRSGRYSMTSSEVLEYMPADETAGPEQTAERSEYKQLVLAGLQQLSEDKRTAVVLRDLKGFSYEEVADMTNTPLGTVKSRLNAARRELRDFLQAKGVQL